jgi:hypothetical protein
MSWIDGFKSLHSFEEMTSFAGSYWNGEVLDPDRFEIVSAGCLRVIGPLEATA